MKKLLNLFLLSLTLCLLTACDDDHGYVNPELEVTANNVAGIWKLTRMSGAPLAEGSFVYIELIRKDCRFRMYDNLNSFDVYRTGGTFAIETDPARGAIIRGIYDNSMGQEWAHRYVVTGLTGERMVWTATDDAEDVSVYERSTLPEEFTEAD